ncbi:hypothetical protein SAMN04489743_0747 [Pseudarthrobacter equi]|uniref:Uncharacterized protein n=1 Tax=Pseudarthrobacter equi TaxID=728066 RepID=A0A1H1UQ27_9MICC|nr:hypothetical protein SAMN04489743_0747 [Pseudarthrobacter equi]
MNHYGNPSPGRTPKPLETIKKMANFLEVQLRVRSDCG